MENSILTHRREHHTSQDKAQFIHQYLNNRVMPLLAPLQIELLKQKPNNIQKFCLNYLQQARHRDIEHSLLKEIENDELPEDSLRDKIKRKRKGNRRGIIGDTPKLTYPISAEHHFTPETNWPQQITVTLIMNIKKCLFFQHLHSNQLIKLIKRMKIISFVAGDVIIREGESGNELYIVETGTLKCQKQGSEDILKVYTKGQVFGELSLLYNHPRSSSVTAIEGGTLYTLSRSQFTSVLHVGMLSKLRECQQLIQKVDIFDTLSIYERNKLYESMQLKTVGPDKYIIKEGEIGNCFFIVAEGQLVAYKQKQHENKLVYTYQRGDYFGQIALLRHLPRQASVKTLTDVRLYFINAECFSRVLGPLQIILKRNQQRYARLTAQLSFDSQI